MATISNTPRPGYVWDSTDNVWYPIGTGPHTHADYITQSTAINPTIVDAKGDIIAATAADTVARLAVGANDTVLTADSSTATGLKWATPAAGGMTLISTTTLSGASTTISSIPTTYKNLQLIIRNYRPVTDGKPMRMQFNSDTNTRYSRNTTFGSNTNVTFGTTFVYAASDGDNTATNAISVIDLIDYTNTTTFKFGRVLGITNNPTTTTNYNFENTFFVYNQTPAITSITLIAEDTTFNAGTALLYGVQ